MVCLHILISNERKPSKVLYPTVITLIKVELPYDI